MRVRTTITVVGLLATGTLALTACNPNSDTTGSSNNAPAAASSTPGATTGKDTKAVPNLVGKGLQAAQDAAQAQGFYVLKSHDSLGQDRHQVLDRDWKVCSQSPAAGKSETTDTTLDLGAVKLAESCPKGGDQAPPAKTGKTMQNFVGKGLAAARNSLPSNASITTKDASGQGRIIILESDWKVCTQTPKPGTAYNGQPVTLTAVKTREKCP
jgi:beta-lactam-binding protein with PASTA domain